MLQVAQAWTIHADQIAATLETLRKAFTEEANAEPAEWSSTPSVKGWTWGESGPWLQVVTSGEFVRIRWCKGEGHTEEEPKTFKRAPYFAQLAVGERVSFDWEGKAPRWQTRCPSCEAKGAWEATPSDLCACGGRVAVTRHPVSHLSATARRVVPALTGSVLEAKRERSSGPCEVCLSSPTPGLAWLQGERYMQREPRGASNAKRRVHVVCAHVAQRVMREEQVTNG